MKLAIIGLRDFDNYDLVKSTIQNLYPELTEIVSGGANGADSLAEKYADEFNISKTIFEAEWSDLTGKSGPVHIKVGAKGKKYNALAGFNRNSLIINFADSILAFWNHKSPGTKDSIDKAKKIGKEVTIVKI